MRIVNTEAKKIPYIDLPIAETFTFDTEGESGFWFKTYMLPKAIGYGYIAINLMTGEEKLVELDREVYPLNGEFRFYYRSTFEK